MHGLKRGLTIFLAAAALAVMGAAGAAAAKPEIYVKEGGVFSPGWTHALNGYDPVSYFTETGPQQGSDLHTFGWKGAVWRFASRDNLNKFVERPQAFAPQYGGYCAFAAAQGRTAPGDPEVWAIHNGKLYVNLNRGIKRKWDKDRDALIARADANWPGILDE
jgi:hypothetical protein